MAPRTATLFAVCALLGCSAPPGRPSETADDAEPSQGKLAVVDLERVLHETARGRAAMAQFELLGQRLQDDLDAKREELQEMEQAIEEARENGVEDEELAQMLAEYQQVAGLAQRLFSTSQQQLEALRDQLTAPILEDVSRIARRIGRDEGFDLIIGNKGLAYVEPDADLTDRVIETYAEEEGEGEPSAIGAEELRLMTGEGAPAPPPRDHDGEGDDPDADPDEDTSSEE